MGSSPKAPPPAPAPDPRIAEEKSRREGIAIGQLERQRRSRSGARSTILGGAPVGTTLTRPTDPVSTIDPGTTAAGRKQAEIETMAGQVAAMPETIQYDLGGDEGGTETITNRAREAKQAELEALRRSISSAELQVLQSARKQKGLAGYNTRTRSRFGVTATKGA